MRFASVICLLVAHVSLFAACRTTSPRTTVQKEAFDGEFLNSLPFESRASQQDVLGNSVAGMLATRGSGNVVTFEELQGLQMQSGGVGAEDPLSGQEASTEAYNVTTENPFFSAAETPLSTFSIDVDTASYTNIRRFIDNGRLPPPAAVRIEEMVNYFHYDYPAPASDAPFSTSVEINQCPWSADAKLVRIGLRGKDIPIDKRPVSNLVFLIDVSGSMRDSNKLPLVKRSLHFLVEQLQPADRVAIVVYAGAAGVVLPSTTVQQSERIHAAIGALESGGSTNGAEGIQLAYDIAVANQIARGNNRVILATDGDFNVGVSSQGELVPLVQSRAKQGVFLSVLGFGMGNLKDSMMESLADHGDGSYHYIDTFSEAKRVLGEQLAGTLLTIAKDVKIQVEFNPAQVGAYRLIGYENRMLRKEDFNDDKKDAGEIGSGHTVTALYEVLPPGKASESVLKDNHVDELRYKGAPGATSAHSDELMTVKIRYKPPTGGESAKMETAYAAPKHAVHPSADFRFASAVAAWGLLLRRGPTPIETDYDLIAALVAGDASPHAAERAAFLRLVHDAQRLTAAH